MHDRISVDHDGHILLIGVNRPEKRNAFDLVTIEQLAAAFDRLGDDREIRVDVLYGHGDHFSTGLDLDDVGPALAERGPQALAGTGAYDPSACGELPLAFGPVARRLKEGASEQELGLDRLRRVVEHRVGAHEATLWWSYRVEPPSPGSSGLLGKLASEATCRRSSVGFRRWSARTPA